MILRNLIIALQLSIITLVISYRLMAQEYTESNFIHYSKQEGLSHNIITGMGQDSTGYVWISTYSGLNRFNGSNFTQYHSTNDSLSLPEEYLRGSTWLDKHRLAIFTGGLHIVNTRTGETRNLFVPYSNKQYQFKFNWVISASSNAKGDIFLLTRSGFYHFDHNYRLVYRFDYYPAEEVATSYFSFGRYILDLDDQRLAVVSDQSVYYYNVAKKQFKKMEPGDCPLLKEILDDTKTAYQFYQLKPGGIIAMDLNGDSLVYFNITKKKRTASPLPFNMARDEFGFRTVITMVSDTMLCITGHVSGFYKMRFYPESGKMDFYPKKYFPFHSCRQLLQDKDHNLWIGTNTGVYIQDNSRSHIQQASIPAELETMFPNIVIDDIYTVGNRVYVAMRGNAGLFVYDKQGLQFLRRVSFGKFMKSADNILSIISANDNTLLVGTNGPLFKLNLKTDEITELMLDKWNRPTDWTADSYKDKGGNVWIAAGNIYKYDAITQKFSIISAVEKPLDKIEWPMLIQGDMSGNIWLAGHGLIRYNTSSQTFDRLIDSFPFIKIPDRQVNAFIVDQQNNLWINSNNNGLIRYDIDKRTFRQFTRDNGLPDNNMTSMIIIGNKLWMATYSGIACVDTQTFQVTSFENEDGFPDLPITSGAKFFYDSKDCKLYIGLGNTIVRFDPNIIFKKSPTPHLFIESLTTSDQKKFLFPGKNLKTSWRNNEITITIGSINFFTSNSQRFAYRMAKDDKADWQQLGTQSTFSISNLSPGFYRIQVKLFSLSHRWPDQLTEFNIMITPPFWKEVWFIILVILLLLFLAYQFLKWRTGNIRKKEQQKTNFEKLKAEEYKNQYELEQISHYFSTSMAGIKNVNDVLWDVTKNLIGRMNYEDCIIYMWNEEKSKMIQKAAHGPKGNLKAIHMQTFDVLPGQGLVGHVIQTREPLLVSDTRKDSRYRVDDMMRLSELCVPIIHDNELIGIIDSEHQHENHFQERDLKILTTIATLVGNKIKQIESEQMLEVKQKEISFINQQLAEAQLSALQAQMNPHFIFNCLNSIKGMILENEQQKASRYLSKFANMIRITLNQSKEIFTTLYENIEHLESYLVMEKLRFDDSFTFKCTVDDNIDVEETLIPTLMIQPLAENAIWHGLMHKKGEKKLTIRFSMLAGTIACTIEDSGIGINRSEELKLLNKPPYQPVGLNNLRNRIKILNEKYETGCSLEIKDLKDFGKHKNGTRAVLRFNIMINKPII
ncbi:MAG: histidine kinase [Chitinophagaceae bacterium]